MEFKLYSPITSAVAGTACRRRGMSTVQTAMVLTLIAVGVIGTVRSLAITVRGDLATTAGGVGDPASLVGIASSGVSSNGGSSGSGSTGGSGGSTTSGETGGSGTGSSDSGSTGGTGGSTGGGDAGSSGGGLCP